MHKFTQGVFDYLHGFWLSLINNGVTDKVSMDDMRFVKFTNVAAAITSLVIAGYIPISIIEKNYFLAAVQVVDLLCVLLVLWLNYSGFHRIARQTYMVVVNVFVLINACVIGFESRVHDIFYFTCFLPLLLFRVKEYKSIVGGVVMAVVSYTVYQHVYPYFTDYNLSMADQMVVYNINIWMKFVLFGIAIYILAYYNHKSEAELADLNSKLECQAVKLKRFNEDLEQFAYIISHDLKAPVRNIGSFMKLLATRYSELLPSEGREFVEMSKTSAERLARQIEDLVSYCRVDRNLPPVSSVDLNNMIKTIQVESGGKIAEANAEVIIERELPVLKDVHSGMIHHVFQNLVANGIKFNTNAFPEVKISFTEEDDHVQFSVADNGIGIDKGFESKLFQMFKRLHTQDKLEGTGIGLAICKKIVNFYNGKIWYESEAGAGTTFYFTLPKHLVTRPFPEFSEIASRPNLISEAA